MDIDPNLGMIYQKAKRVNEHGVKLSQVFDLRFWRAQDGQFKL